MIAHDRLGRMSWVGLAIFFSLAAAWSCTGAHADTFRVCADPNNLPFSNQKQAGFENKLASIVAADIGKQLTYVWQPQGRRFIAKTIGSDACDAVMGVPVKLDGVETTEPYYTSTYVFLYKTDRHYDLRSITDPRLRHLSVGVQLIGNEGYNTPPSEALSQQGIVANLVGYNLSGNYQGPNPPSRIVDAVERGVVDVAAVWGPLAGYFAKQSPVELTLQPIIDTAQFQPLLFRYAIAVGVRPGNDALRSQINTALARRRGEIATVLEQYGVPRVDGDRRAATIDPN